MPFGLATRHAMKANSWFGSFLLISRLIASKASVCSVLGWFFPGCEWLAKVAKSQILAVFRHWCTLTAVASELQRTGSNVGLRYVKNRCLNIWSYSAWSLEGMTIWSKLAKPHGWEQGTGDGTNQCNTTGTAGERSALSLAPGSTSPTARGCFWPLGRGLLSSVLMAGAHPLPLKPWLSKLCSAALTLLLQG